MKFAIPSSSAFRSALSAAALALGLAFAQRPAVLGAEAAAPPAEAPKSGGIKFSHPRGFCTAPFELTLSLSPGKGSGQIRYTLDGSAPTQAHGQAYAQPIPVRGTTIVRASVIDRDGKASRAQTHTYLFTSDIIRQSPDGLPPAGWPYAWGENHVDYGMDQDVVDDPKYRALIEPALQSLPACSLVMDLEDLFGEQRGIYSHSSQEGRESERPASLEYIHPGNPKDGFQEDCGVRIRGGFSSGPFNPKHAFRFFFRKEYGAGKLKHPLFGESAAKEFDSIDLRCAQNYSWNIGSDPRGLFLRDQLSRDLQLALGQPAARGDFCHLFLNGQYWGLYDFCERPEASFGATYLGGRKEDYDVIKTGGVGAGGNMMGVGATDGSLESWRRLVEGAKADLANNPNYFRLLGRNADGSPDPKAEVLLDPTNLVDYLLVIWYGGNLDAPVTRFGGNRAPNNWHAMRNRSTRDGFRFFVWDAEHTLLDVEEDRTGPFPGGDRAEASQPQWLFQRCANNAEFRVLVADRIQRHFGPGGVLSSPEVLARFQKRVQQIEAAVICESARWGDVTGGFAFGPPGPGRAGRIGPDGSPRPMPKTRDGEWRAEVRRITDKYLPQRTDIVRFQLWRQGFVSDLPTPKPSCPPGPIPRGESLRLIVDQGEIWYTTDGLDPRLVGGEARPTAKRAEATIPIAGRVVMAARVRFQGEWGPLFTGGYQSP